MAKILRMIPLAAMLAALLMIATSCIDPEPGEISIRATKAGKPFGCAVQLFNAKGNQVQEQFTDTKGLLYIKELAPGDYTVKFIDNNLQPYPAVKQVTVDPGGSVILDVELTEEPAAAPE